MGLGFELTGLGCLFKGLGMKNKAEALASSFFVPIGLSFVKEAFDTSCGCG